jgi:DNA-directed RNA polymerase subunit RPC12/RpoP
MEVFNLAGRQNSINPVANDNNTAKTNMMDMWRDSIDSARRNAKAPVNIAKSEHEARSELEQKIRNGEVECPTCAARAYKDQSTDGGVSFQAAKGISASTAGVTVMRHEHEHVSAGKAQQQKDGLARNSTVGLEYARCPECGRTYVAGGITKTTTRPATPNQSSLMRASALDVKA